MSYFKIPKDFTVGGQPMEVRIVERCDDNKVGLCFLAAGYIEIADKCNRCDAIPDRMKVNTFYHELTHAILDTMGEDELSANEKFVCSFSSFLTEAMANAYFAVDAPPTPNEGVDPDRDAKTAGISATSTDGQPHNPSFLE